MKSDSDKWGKAFAKGCVSLNPSVLELYRDLARFLH